MLALQPGNRQCASDCRQQNLCLKIRRTVNTPSAHALDCLSGQDKQIRLSRVWIEVKPCGRNCLTCRFSQFPNRNLFESLHERQRPTMLTEMTERGQEFALDVFDTVQLRRECRSTMTGNSWKRSTILRCMTSRGGRCQRHSATGTASGSGFGCSECPARSTRSSNCSPNAETPPIRHSAWTARWHARTSPPPAQKGGIRAGR